MQFDQWEMLEHQHYNPDLAPSDFHYVALKSSNLLEDIATQMQVFTLSVMHGIQSFIALMH